MKLYSDIALENGIVGGLILGTSASAFLLLTGNVTGLSGITTGLVDWQNVDWKWSYMTGLTIAGIQLAYFYSDSAFGTPSLLTPNSIILAGVLTGFGTRLSNGCTSGHGLCGLARRSPRSLSAVVTFMTTGAMSAYFTRLPAYRSLFYAEHHIGTVFEGHPTWAPTAAIIGGAFMLFKNQLWHHIAGTPKCATPTNTSSVTDHILAFLAGLGFGIGLGVSGMCNAERVLRFLDFSNPVIGWDPTLMSVLGAGVAVTFTTFHYLTATNTAVICPPIGKKINLGTCVKMGTAPENMKFDWKLFVGSAIFGIGWGLAGICPGPAFVSLGAGVESAALFVPAMLSGMIAKEALRL